MNSLSVSSIYYVIFFFCPLYICMSTPLSNQWDDGMKQVSSSQTVDSPNETIVPYILQLPCPITLLLGMA